VVSAGTVLAATALVGVTVLGGVAPAAADGKVVIGGGAGIVVEGDTYCTLTAIGNDRTGALVGQFLIGLHTFLVAGFMVLMTQRWGRPKIGWWAALFYLTTPWTYRLAAIPYVEGPLCAAMIGSVWAVSRCWNLKTGGSWILVGVRSGWAMSCK
jgi:hypothetical protein